METTTLVILAAACLTYLTRIGGHLVLSRFERIHPRVEAALNAVPAAVLTTLFAPTLVFGGPAETLTLVVAALAALYLPPLAVTAIGWIGILVLRVLFDL